MILDKRLDCVYKLLEPNLNLADIGCDHGYLSIQYALNNDAKVLAIDNKKEPLSRCLENVKLYNVSNKVTTILSDGINDIDDSIKQVAICGMGGNNIIDILDISKLKNIEYFILEPNNNANLLRRYLSKIQFKIIEEYLVEENDYIYEIIKAQKGIEKLNEKQMYFGPKILAKKDEIFERKYQKRKLFLLDVLKKIPNTDSNKNKISSLLDEIKMIEEEL